MTTYEVCKKLISFWHIHYCSIFFFFLIWEGIVIMIIRLGLIVEWDRKSLTVSFSSRKRPLHSHHSPEFPSEPPTLLYCTAICCKFSVRYQALGTVATQVPTHHTMWFCVTSSHVLISHRIGAAFVILTWGAHVCKIMEITMAMYLKMDFVLMFMYSLVTLLLCNRFYKNVWLFLKLYIW